VPPPPVRRRSSWILRGLFGGVFVVLALEGVIVAWLVGTTVLGMSGVGASAGTGIIPIGRRVVSPGQAGATASALDEDRNVWDKHGPINILLLGVDKDDCEGLVHTRATRTDTIILLRIDPQTKRAAMLSIPRDLYVFIGQVYKNGKWVDYGAAKINTAHAIGANASPDDVSAGPRLLEQAIQSNLELSVHRYIRIDFEGFKRLVDEGLGGLDMDLPASAHDPSIALYDTNYPDGKCGTMTISFAPGRQHLGGDQVLQYARSRYSTSDFDRSRRQMEVLMAIRNAVKSPSVIPRLPRLIRITMDTIDTDLSTSEIISLGRIARGMSGDNIASFRVDENVVYDDNVLVGDGVQFVLRLQQDKWDVLREQFLNIEPPPAPTPTPTATPAFGG